MTTPSMGSAVDPSAAPTPASVSPAPDSGSAGAARGWRSLNGPVSTARMARIAAKFDSTSAAQLWVDQEMPVTAPDSSVS